MISAIDRAKYPLPVTPSRGTSVIDRADEAVDIREILRQMKVWAPEGDYYSYKIWCPFHDEHSDQLDKNCRIYPPDHLYCWAMHGYMGSSYLYARWKGMSTEQAAIDLLDERGLLQRPWRERWNELIDKREYENQTTTYLGNKNDITAALSTSLSMNSQYVRNQYHPLIRARWKIILAVLDELWKKEPTIDDMHDFFDTSLTALSKLAKMVEEQTHE